MGFLFRVCNLTVILLAVGIGYLASIREHFFYRAKQSLKAVYDLQNMPQERIENFLKSYDMFNLGVMENTPEHLTLLKDYYETLNHLCTIGDYEKMYLPPLRDITKDTYSNQRLYEKRFMEKLQLGPGKKALDIGCGRGRVAHHVASETGANVVGVQIDKDQLRQCREFAASQGMSDKLEFVEANYNNRLPFEDNTFDAVYYVQVIGGYGTDLLALYKEIFRVLKPGGYAAFEDYIVLPKYDPKNALHARYVQAAKAILGVAMFVTEEDYMSALKGSGLDIVYRQNGSVAEQYNLLEGDRDFFVPLTKLTDTLSGFGVVPKHFADLLERMTRGTDDCIEAHRQHLVTGDIETLVRKP